MEFLKTNVVIAGAGPTGLMAAALLARSGVSVRILDKNIQQAHESRAFGVHAKSMELFFSMGLAGEFLQKGMIATGVQIFVGGQQVGELNFEDINRDDTPYPFLLMVPQWDIEGILAEEVKKLGVQIEHQMEVIGCEQTSENVRVTAKDKNGAEINIECQYLIGADGAHSVVRRKLNLDFIGAPYPQGFLLADCKIEWPLDYEHMKLFLRGRNLAFYMPLRGKSFCRIIAIQPVSQEKDGEIKTSENVSLDEVQEVLIQASGMPVKLSDPIWTSRYRVHHRAVNHYQVGRIFLAGDAAHIHSPAGAQGMNTGVQDAANLAWKIVLAVKRKSTNKLLATYHDERWPVGQKILKYTDNMFAGMTAQSAWGVWLRNNIVPLIGRVMLKIKAARYKLFHFVSQLGIRYHSNEFILEDPTSHATREWRNGLTAGHRAPNGLIQKDFDVFDVIKGYQFHVLAFSKKSLSSDEIAELHERLKSIPEFIGLPVKTHLIANSLMGCDDRIIRAESSQAFDAFGLTHQTPQALFLVRPDGYIAYRRDALDVDRLVDFLKRFG